MKRIIHPPLPHGAKPKLPEVEMPSNISVTRLIEDGLLALYREIKNIVALSVNGKLDAASARDLRDHLKLLFELKDREDQFLHGLTDEQLESQAKELLNDKNQNSNSSGNNQP